MLLIILHLLLSFQIYFINFHSIYFNLFYLLNVLITIFVYVITLYNIWIYNIKTCRKQEKVEVEPYRLSEIYSLIPDMIITRFSSIYSFALLPLPKSMAVNNQIALLVLLIKNKLCGGVTELVNSRNPTTWNEIQTPFHS